MKLAGTVQHLVGDVSRHYWAFGVRPARMNSPMMVRSLYGLLIGLLPLAVSPVQGQENTAAPAVESPISAAETEIKAALNSAFSSNSSATTAQSPSAKLTRWFELNTATLYSRYRFVKTSAGLTTGDQAQHKETFQGRFKFDESGKYSLDAGLFSGRNFIATWNNTGWGTGVAQSNLALKQLYFAAKPIKGLEFQVGGLYILRGESTEITSYDDDGYIVGERVSIKRPEQLFLDEISVSRAYLGDTGTPNINKRYHRLEQSNYHHFLLAKKIGKRAAVSADYTFQAGRETLREAIKVNTAELRVLDSMRFENYQRTKIRPDYGFALGCQKILYQRLKLEGGYAQVDPFYGNLNADRFLSGKRVYLMGSYQFSPEFTLSTYLTQAVANHQVPVAQQTRFDLIVSYNLLKSLQRTGWF
jgi:hypothetical protein